MPDLAPDTIALLEHLASQSGQPSAHDNVKAAFKDLLVREFGVDRDSLNFEVRVPVIRGRLDALIGRTVFEAKRSLDKEMDDVLRRMPDYLADREREEGQPFVGIASDGRKWIVFELVNGELIKAKETILDPAKGETFLAWLDGVLALKASLSPDALTVRAELGQDSVAYRSVDRDLLVGQGASSDAASKLSHRHLTRLARLAYLAPDVIAAILEGRQPRSMTSRSLLRASNIPLGWNEQRKMFGI